MQDAKNVMGRVAEERLKAGNTKVPFSASARNGTQVPVRRDHFDEEEYQDGEEDLFQHSERRATALERSGKNA